MIHDELFLLAGASNFVKLISLELDPRQPHYYMTDDLRFRCFRLPPAVSFAIELLSLGESDGGGLLLVAILDLATHPRKSRHSYRHYYACAKLMGGAAFERN